jgi:predicted 3-demethylubiquinone-9 3-methyltransferase (glyoxalase superfamily)
VVCKTEQETETLWNKLIEGGTILMEYDKYEWSLKYGWVQDRFGISWQLSYTEKDEVGQKFTPMLLFTGERNGRAENAIHFYTSLFENSSIMGIMRYWQGENAVLGAVQHAQFKLGKQVFMAMDSSLQHNFGFNEAVSLVVECDTQQEIDNYWYKLTESGEESQCGWLKDQFGVS